MNGNDDEEDDDDDYEDDDDEGEDNYSFVKGDVRKSGQWDVDDKIYNPKIDAGLVTSCGCTEGSKPKSCVGKRVRHVFFKCPYCSSVVSEHRADHLYGSPMSLWCMDCDRHLWIALTDWYVFAESEKKRKTRKE